MTKNELSHLLVLSCFLILYEVRQQAISLRYSNSGYVLVQNKAFAEVSFQLRLGSI